MLKQFYAKALNPAAEITKTPQIFSSTQEKKQVNFNQKVHKITKKMKALLHAKQSQKESKRKLEGEKTNVITKSTHSEVNEGTESLTETALPVLAETTSFFSSELFPLSGLWRPRSKLVENPCRKSTGKLGFWATSEVENGDDTAAIGGLFGERDPDSVL